VWPWWLKRERDTTVCRTTLGHWMMNLWMVLHRGDTTQSSTHGTLLVETDSETGHDSSERRSVELITRENKSTVRCLTTSWPQGCSSSKSPPIYPKKMKKSTRMSIASRRCWTQQQWWTQSTTAKTESRVTSLTTGRVPMGTRQAASLHPSSIAEGVIRTITTCAMSSTAEMQVVR
jgi:hypothetical protein